MTKKKLVGEKRVYSAYISTLLFITERSQDWNSSRSESRSWCRGHGGMFFTGLLPLACSACSLIEPKTTSSGVAPPTRGLPPWSLTEKMPYSWILWRHFLNWSSFLCDNSSCVKLTQTCQYREYHPFFTKSNLVSLTFLSDLKTIPDINRARRSLVVSEWQGLGVNLSSRFPLLYLQEKQGYLFFLM